MCLTLLAAKEKKRVNLINENATYTKNYLYSFGHNFFTLFLHLNQDISI